MTKLQIIPQQKKKKETNQQNCTKIWVNYDEIMLRITIYVNIQVQTRCDIINKLGIRNENKTTFLLIT